MGVGDGRRQRIGRVGLRAIGVRQEDTDHCLDLFLAGVTHADHTFFDVVGSIFGDLESGLGGGKKRDSAGMAELEGGGGILGDKGLFHGNGMGCERGDNLTKVAMEPEQSPAKVLARIARQDTMADMGEAGSGQFDYSPAHAGKARIKAQNANRVCHEDTYR
jgi:hypothetical protein